VGPLASYASHELQREVTIGDLDVDLGRITRVQLDEDNDRKMLPGPTDPRMAHASRMVLFFRSCGALLKMTPDYAQLVQPDVLAGEDTPTATANWQFRDERPRFPDVTAIDVDQGIVRYRENPALDADFSVSLDTQATAKTSDRRCA
jgi:hypothetical protein